MAINGWIRLWIFITGIWSVIVLIIALTSLYEIYNSPLERKAFYNLSASSQIFYKDLEDDETGPSFSASFHYDDGTKQIIRFPNALENNIADIDITSR